MKKAFMSAAALVAALVRALVGAGKLVGLRFSLLVVAAVVCGLPPEPRVGKEAMGLVKQQRGER